MNDVKGLIFEINQKEHEGKYVVLSVNQKNKTLVIENIDTKETLMWTFGLFESTSGIKIDNRTLLMD